MYRNADGPGRTRFRNTLFCREVRQIHSEDDDEERCLDERHDHGDKKNEPGRRRQRPPKVLLSRLADGGHRVTPRAPEVFVREVVARLAVAEEGNDVEQACQDCIHKPNCIS